MTPYRHIIWDWNGTLFNDAWLCVEIINRMLADRGLPKQTLDDYQQNFDFPVRNYYERLGFDFAVEPYQEPADEFIDEYERRRFECVLQTGARGVLAELAARGLTQSILSAYKHPRLEEAVAHFGLGGYFATLVGLDDHYAEGKTALGRRLLAAVDVPPREMLFVGDTTHDYDVASAMGVDCVLISSGHQTRERLARCGVPVLGGLAEVSERIKDKG